MKISNLAHKVELCSARDEIDANGQVLIRRQIVLSDWAAIEATSGSFFSTLGEVVDEMRGMKSHRIFIRYRAHIEIGTAGWIYETRLSSAPRWYKILAIEDCGEESRFWRFDCRLVSKGDEIMSPVAVNGTDQNSIFTPTALPEGVEL